MFWINAILIFAGASLVKTIADSQTVNSGNDTIKLSVQKRTQIRTQKTTIKITDYRQILYKKLKIELESKHRRNISSSLTTNMITVELTGAKEAAVTLGKILAIFDQQPSETAFHSNLF
jgi:hypothetical protein